MDNKIRLFLNRLIESRWIPYRILPLSRSLVNMSLGTYLPIRSSVREYSITDDVFYEGTARLFVRLNGRKQFFGDDWQFDTDKPHSVVPAKWVDGEPK